MTAATGLPSRDLPAESRRDVWVLTYAVFGAGLCSIVYELLIATTVSYFEGDAITYFSLTIGLYMAAMGAGAYLSKAITRDLLAWFVAVEIALATVGGFSVALLYLMFAETDWFLGAYVLLTLLVGVLIGLEIPLLTRILDDYTSLRVNIAHVLSLDYLGALVASLAFPLLLLPWLGVFASALVVGLLNATIAVVVCGRFGSRLAGRTRVFVAATVVSAAGLAGLLAFSGNALALWTGAVYDGRVLHAERSRHQEIVLTRFRGDVRLFLDGNLQFASVDEHRYHEALVHVPLSVAERRRRVLLLGAGDGLAARELLKHKDVESITVVDLDPAILALAREHPEVRRLNGGALDDPRVTTVAADAFGFLALRRALWDVIIADLPDPNNAALARLYTREFYELVRQNLAPDGVFVTQATSPYYASRAFRGIEATVGAVFPGTLAYHAWVPSFGDWGFVLAAGRPLAPADADPARLPPGLRHLDGKRLETLFVLDRDRTDDAPVAVSTLDRPAILTDYLAGWRQWPR